MGVGTFTHLNIMIEYIDEAVMIDTDQMAAILTRLRMQQLDIGKIRQRSEFVPFTFKIPYYVQDGINDGLPEHQATYRVIYQQHIRLQQMRGLFATTETTDSINPLKRIIMETVEDAATERRRRFLTIQKIKYMAAYDMVYRSGMSLQTLNDAYEDE